MGNMWENICEIYWEICENIGKYMKIYWEIDENIGKYMKMWGNDYIKW
jgi:hypothetical protein